MWKWHQSSVHKLQNEFRPSTQRQTRINPGSKPGQSQPLRLDFNSSQAGTNGGITQRWLQQEGIETSLTITPGGKKKKKQLTECVLTLHGYIVGTRMLIQDYATL